MTSPLYFPPCLQANFVSYLGSTPLAASLRPSSPTPFPSQEQRPLPAGVPLYAVRFPSWNALSLLRLVDEGATRVWEANGNSPNASMRLQQMAAVHKGVKNAEAAGGGRVLNSLRRLWNEIPYATNHTAYPRISTPAESVAGHLEGLILLRQIWGGAVGDCWREGDFFEKAGACGLPESSYREALDGDFSLTWSPGSHETVAGIDYRLHWKGQDAAGAERDVLLATVGFIRRREGFGFTLVQGGPRLTQVKTGGGKRGDLLRLVQKRFGGDPRAWLLGEVVRRLRREFPASPLYWLQAERRAPLYCHILDPTASGRTLFPSVGREPLDKLRSLVSEARRKSSDRKNEPDHAWSLEEATRLPVVIERLNGIAKTFGFRPEDGNDAWWAL